jgi:hypothetical protein
VAFLFDAISYLGGTTDFIADANTYTPLVGSDVDADALSNPLADLSS